EGFDTNRYVPCLRTDDLVFRLHDAQVRQRLAKATGVEMKSVASLRQALTALFEHFTRHGAKACAISLPPAFAPHPIKEQQLDSELNPISAGLSNPRGMSRGVFWMLAEHCREFKLPFDLMIGVNRKVYANGVYQGQDLFDQRTSLIQYAELFNAFPEVT